MKTAIPKKAIDVLRRAKDSILKNPEKYDQGNFCGTACCIAGHIVANEKPSVWKKLIKAEKRGEWITLRQIGEPLDPVDAVPLVAGRILVGLVNIDPLFDSSLSWPSPFREEYTLAVTYNLRAEVAAQRIEHFIETGE